VVLDMAANRLRESEGRTLRISYEPGTITGEVKLCAREGNVVDVDFTCFDHQIAPPILGYAAALQLVYYLLEIRVAFRACKFFWILVEIRRGKAGEVEFCVKVLPVARGHGYEFSPIFLICYHPSREKPCHGSANVLKTFGGELVFYSCGLGGERHFGGDFMLVEVFHAYVGVFLGRPSTWAQLEGFFLDEPDKMIEVLFGYGVSDYFWVRVAKDVWVGKLGAVIVPHPVFLDKGSFWPFDGSCVLCVFSHPGLGCNFPGHVADVFSVVLDRAVAGEDVSLIVVLYGPPTAGVGAINHITPENADCVNS